MTVTLGIANAALGRSSETPRINTQCAYDFAYWVGTFLAEGSPDDYLDNGPETDAASIISWAASQTGVTVADTYATLAPTLTNDMTVEEALRTRGAILVCQTKVAVSMGLHDVVDIVNGRYFLYKVTYTPQSPATCQSSWDYGSYLPGMLY